MFPGVTLSVELKTVLLCVLLLHYSSVEQLQSNCSVHCKLVGCPFLPSPRKVTIWHDLLKEWFDHRNGAYVPLSQIDDAHSISVLSFKEYVNWSTNYLMQMHSIVTSTNERLNVMQMQFNNRLDEVVSLIRGSHGCVAESSALAEVPEELLRVEMVPPDLTSLKKLHMEAAYFSHVVFQHTCIVYCTTYCILLATHALVPNMCL